MPDTSWIEEFDPEEIDVQAMDGFHLGGSQFSASFELSDPYDEYGRSYLLEIEMDQSIQYEVRLQIDDSLRSHVSFAPRDHVALELGGIIHTLPGDGASETTTLPEGVLHKLWARSHDQLFAIGNRGVTYLREGGEWEQLETYNSAVFNSIFGRSDGPVYIVGNRGVLARLDGKRWQPIEIHTEENLTAVSAGPDGEIYIGGDDGTAYELRDSELIPLKSETVDYADIREFRGKRYWSDADFGISVQDGREIIPLLETGQGFTMTASDDFLVVAGWHEFFIFDGENWDGFELGYDGNIFLSRLDMAQFGG